MTAEELADATQRALAGLSARSLDDRADDVCPQCGLHMLRDPIERLRWLDAGGSVTCVTCLLTKTRAATK